VLDPLEVVVSNWPEGRTDEIDAPYWPADVGKPGTRKLPFTRRLFIEKGDFAEVPPKGWHRLSPGTEVRLRHAYVLRCDTVEKDAATGEVRRLVCSIDLDTLNAAPKGRKVPGTIHWVAADASVPCEVRLYDRLFAVEEPGKDEKTSFLEELNPASLVVMKGARIEPSVRGDAAGTRYQFERQGYFMADPVDSRADALVFNRIVTLKDTWSRTSAAGDTATSAKPSAARAAESASKAADAPASAPKRPVVRDDPRHAALVARGIAADQADVLLADAAVLAFFEATAATLGDAPLAARWTTNEIVRETKTRPLADVPVTPARFAELIRMTADGTVSASAAKDVFARMAKDGGDPAAIVAAGGLRQVSDASALDPVVDAVLAAHPADVERYRAGKTQLLGFFVGKVIAASGGKANPAMVRELLSKRLG